VTPARRQGLAALAVLLLTTACGGSTVEGVRVDDAWVRPTPPGAAVAAAYFRLHSGVDDVLVAASVDPAIAASAELHATTTDAATGTTAMEELEAIPIEASSTVTFEPGGGHVMLVDLAQPLAQGATFELTLELQRSGAQVVTVSVGEGPP
jgi:copper(I)-binding protein